MILFNISLKQKSAILTILLLIVSLTPTISQTAWFTDGYHGGIYGHYPKWQARFMVEELEKHPEWAINIEIEPETWDSISVTDPENFRAFQNYFEITGSNNRIEFVNPTWSQPYSYNISGESIIRQFYYGIKKTREYFPTAKFLTYAVEEPCFTSSLPQILKGFGYKYAVLRNPNTCWGGYTSAFGRDLVNWIGPDGTSITAVPRYAVEELSTESTWQTESWTNSNEFINKCLEYGIKYPIGMCFQDAGWDGGPWKNEYQPTIYTTWSNYFEMINGKVQPDDWHFTQEDIKPGLVWGAQVLQQIAIQVRKSENRIIEAEKIAAMDYLLNGKNWPEKDFAEAWRNLMLAQHHDCWIVPYNGRPGDTWADKVVTWTSETNRIASDRIKNQFNGANLPNQIRVYNTLGYPRKEEVIIALPDEISSQNIAVTDVKGKTVPSQLLSENGKSKLYFLASAPSMGYSTYRLKFISGVQVQKKEIKSSNDKISLETDYYKVIFDPAQGGTIISLIDKKSGNRELVENGKQLNDLRGYFYNEEKFHNGSESTATVSITDNDEILIKVKVENEIAGQPYTQLITFYKNNPRIDFNLNIDWKGQPGIGHYNNSNNYESTDRNKAFYNDNYKLHIRFPFNEIGDKLYKNAPFDVTKSKLDNTLYSSWDSIKHNVILNWVDLTNQKEDYGIALLTDHTTSYLQTDSLILGLTVQYIGKALWGRNYKVDGPTEINYALLPHPGNWENGEIESASNRWNQPMVVRFSNNSQEPAEFSILETLGDNLEITSMIIDEDKLIVRLYNTSSTNVSRDVIWNMNFDKIEQVDLNGDLILELNPIKKEDRKLHTNLNIPQFGFVTLKLTKTSSI